MNRKRIAVRVSIGLGALALISWALVYLVQPTAREAAAHAARKRCEQHGWSGKLMIRRYRDTGSGLAEGLQQEFEVDGTDPKMAIWVEVRRPLYAPVWRVAEILEERVDPD
jgi:hypothetical protein